MLFPTGKLQVSENPSPNSLSAFKEKGKQSKQSLYHVSFKYSTDCRHFSSYKYTENRSAVPKLLTQPKAKIHN